jgi:hypothetical protein
MKYAMKFYSLNSIIAANKDPIPLHTPTDSFGVAPARAEAYIEPTFDKIEFDKEKPPIILISAVGATGKTTLARVLSYKNDLPLLDLAKHKPVGDNTLTGLLTNAFRIEDLTSVFQRISQGTFGVIIDGIDEGRSKTTEKGFQAFLDDIAKLCRVASDTSFVLLGRTQILDDCWLYLADQKIAAGLITINPFDIQQARTYIDNFTQGLNSAHVAEYCEIRDMILDRLGAAFTDGAPGSSQSFLSFIGYPPVLDAIVTLLQQEQNYHRLKGELHEGDADGIEVGLLQRIASYILQREKDEKVIPNILSELIEGMPQNDQRKIIEAVYEGEEQCLRLTSYCLGRHLELRPIGHPAIDNEYEDRLRSFLPEHPFITSTGRRFRNAVFEAVALSTLIQSTDASAVDLALDYADTHKHNYHLLYLLHRMAPGRKVPISALRAIIGSALEFQSRTASVQITVGDPTTENWETDPDQAVQIEIEIVMGGDEDQSKRFVFESDVQGAGSVSLGHRLSSTYVFLPCEVSMFGAQELEVTAPTMVFARKVVLRSPALVLRAPSTSADEKQVLFAAEALDADIDRITPHGADLILAAADQTGIRYPAILYVRGKVDFSNDGLLRKKYLQLRRILVLFRSHSRGTLARYRAKIEHERVLRNPAAWAILQQLLKDNILTCEGNFYFLQPDNVDKHLGVSWIALRKGETSDKLERYLQSIR